MLTNADEGGEKGLLGSSKGSVTGSDRTWILGLIIELCMTGFTVCGMSYCSGLIWNMGGSCGMNCGIKGCSTFILIGLPRIFSK